MVPGERGSSAEASNAKKSEPVTSTSSVPAITDVLITADTVAKQVLGDHGNWVVEIDTSTVTGADISTSFYPETSIVRAGFWMGHPWIVAVFSSLSGFLAAGIFMATALSLEGRDPARQLPARRGDDNPIVATSLLIFFGTIYFTGEFLYGKLGNKAEHRRVQELRKQHLPLIGLTGRCLRFLPAIHGLFLWYVNAPGLAAAGCRPLTTGLFDPWHHRRNPEPSPVRFPAVTPLTEG